MTLTTTSTMRAPIFEGMTQAETVTLSARTATDMKSTPLRADDVAKHETTTSSWDGTTMSDLDSETLPPLHFSYRSIYIFLYIGFLVFCNVVIPVLLYYLLGEGSSQFPHSLSERLA
jgi:hypothetical protein